MKALKRRRSYAIAASLLALGAVGGAVLGLSRAPSTTVPTGPATVSVSPAWEGWQFHRAVPAMRLTSARGAAVSLRELRGEVIVLAPSLTLCHEICPLTTQAFSAMERRLARDGLDSRVAFVEATVDPWRDSPARLRAYARLTGARFLMLTGSVSQLRRFWDFFGIGFRRVPQGDPPDVDWLTHRPETFDIDHTDGVFLIDQHGYERAFYPGIADVGGHISPALRALLTPEGRQNISHPHNPWTEAQLLAGMQRLLGLSAASARTGGPSRSP
jgi:cytochrome oxidase Cu insertion factor (SCO1/SenC/PrrC family)